MDVVRQATREAVGFLGSLDAIVKDADTTLARTFELVTPRN